MTEITDGVRVTGAIKPTDTTDTYATHEAEFGKGGRRTVANVTARDAIPADRREVGMLAYIEDTGLEFRLVGGLLNASWQLNSGGGISGVAVPAIVGGRLSAGASAYEGSSGSTALALRPALSDLIALYSMGADEWSLYSIPAAGVLRGVAGDDPSDPSDPSGDALVADTNYDVFAYVIDPSAGHLGLWMEGWTDDTSRAVALGRQDGVRVHGTNPELLYLGTIRTIDDGGVKFVDDAQRRFVWNVFNRVERLSHVRDTTASWTEGSATFVAMNGGAAEWKYEFVNGGDAGEVSVEYAAIAEHTPTATGAAPLVLHHSEIGVGFDSTTVLDASSTVGIGQKPQADATFPLSIDADDYGVQIEARCSRSVSAGYHFMQAIARYVGSTGGILRGARDQSAFHARIMS